MKELKGFKRGINLGGWFSQCDYSKDRLDNFIREEDIIRIASWGLDHVRLPIDYNILENNDGTYIKEGFERIDRAVKMCIDHGLNIIIDLHKTAGFSFDYGENETGFFENKAYRDRFVRLWEELAKHFGIYKAHAAFELLNEVTDKSFIDVWNEVSHECIAAIRKYSPDIPVLVGSYWNNSCESVKDLAAPYDENTYYNFHCYDPLKFTHQGATWTNGLLDPDDRFPFDECDITPDYFEQRFAEAIAKAEAEGTGLYCGEYGVIDIVAPEDALKWFKAINEVLVRHNIGRAAWSYKVMDFGIGDARMDSVRDELLRYL